MSMDGKARNCCGRCIVMSLVAVLGISHAERSGSVGDCELNKAVLASISDAGVDSNSLVSVKLCGESVMLLTLPKAALR